MEINFPVPEHVTTLWSDTEWMKYYNKDTAQGMIGILILGLCVLLIVLAYEFKAGRFKQNSMPILGFAGIITVPLIACALLVTPTVGRNTLLTNYVFSSTKTSEFTHPVPAKYASDRTVLVMPTDYGKVFNTAIEKKYGIKAKDVNKLPYPTDGKADAYSNEATDYTQNSHDLKCAFDYTITKKNNFEQIVSLKMKGVNCREIGTSKQTFTPKK